VSRPVFESRRRALELRKIGSAGETELQLVPRICCQQERASERQRERESVACQFRHGPWKTKKGATYKLMILSQLRLIWIHGGEL